jgi:hypothetical protein
MERKIPKKILEKLNEMEYTVFIDKTTTKEKIKVSKMHN